MLPDVRVSRDLLGDGGAWGSEKQSFLAPNVTESNPAGLGVGPGLCVLHKCPRTVPMWGSLARCFERRRCDDLVPRFRAAEAVVLRKGSRP